MHDKISIKFDPKVIEHFIVNKYSIKSPISRIPKEVILVYLQRKYELTGNIGLDEKFLNGNLAVGSKSGGFSWEESPENRHENFWGRVLLNPGIGHTSEEVFRRIYPDLNINLIIKDQFMEYGED